MCYFRLFLLHGLLIVSCMSGTLQQENISDFYRIQIIPASFSFRQHSDIFVLNPENKWDYLASIRDSEWPQKLPWGYKGIVSRQFSVSEDGKNLLYIHNSVLAGKKDKKVSGLYLFEYGKGEKLIKPGINAGASRYPKPIPDHMLVIWKTVYLTDGSSVQLVGLGGNAYHQAVIEDNEFLLDSLFQIQEIGINEPNYWQLTPTQLAVALKNEKMSIRLIDELKLEESDLPILVLTAATYHSPVVLGKLLAEFQLGIDSSLYPESPLHAILSYPFSEFSTNILPERPVNSGGAMESIQAFWHAGWDINRRDKEGKTLLFLTQDMEILQFLIHNGIDANIQDDRGNLALHQHLSYKEDDRYQDRWERDVYPRISLLASKTSNIDLPNQNGITSLQKAIQGNKIRSAEYLIALGANPEIPFVWANLGPNIRGQSIRERINYLKKDSWWKEVNK